MITIKDLLERYSGMVKEKEPLSRHSTIRIGGPADFFCQPQSEQELMQLFRLVRDREVPMVIVGKGSNILFSDQGFRGIVIQPGPRLAEMRMAEPELLEAGCAVDSASLIRFCADNELTGLEYLIGMPSMLGGAIAMNAGAYGQEIGNMVERLRLVDADGISELERSEIGFRYRRTSGLKGRFIVKAWLRLGSVSRDKAYLQTREVLAKRRETQPLDKHSLGSVFKRVPDHFPGKLIEDAGCKGMRKGDIEVSTMHANFFINTGAGTAADMIALIDEVKQRVREHSDIELPLEIKLIGFDS